MRFKTLSKRWLADLKLRSTPATHHQARYHVRLLSEIVGDTSEVTSDHVRALIKRRQAEGVSVSTINGHLSALRAIIRWGRREGHWLRAPEIQLLPQPKKIPRTIPRAGIEELLRVCEGRLRVFVLLARFSLARHSEILGLRWQDIDFQSGAVTIRKPKGHRERVVYVPAPVIDELIRYRPTLTYAEDSDYLFQSQKRRRQPVGTMHKPLREAFKRAGIYRPGMQTTHALRHSGASELIRATDIYTLSEILGHRDLRSTLTYLHSNDERKREASDALL